MSGRNSINPAIWLVPGADGIFSSGLLTAGGNLALIAWACLMTLNFHFSYTDSVYIQRLFFIRQEVWKLDFTWNVQFVSRFNTAFTIKRGASQQLKQVISERLGERKKKVIYQQRVGLYSKKMWHRSWKSSNFKASVTVFPYTDLPAGKWYIYFDNWVHITASI